MTIGQQRDRHRDALEEALTTLNDTISGLGLRTEIVGPVTLLVSGETPRPEDTSDAQPVAMRDMVRPLSQLVTLRSHEGQIWWCWVWGGPEPEGLEFEPIVPMEEIGEVARQLRNVVALGDT